MSLPIAKIRQAFPILRRLIDGHPLAYLDNAATTQKPDGVLDAMNAYYRTQNANAHRGMHPLAEEATDAYEGARGVVQKFLHACHSEEIIFTKSCTEAINLAAKSWGRTNLHPGDRVILTILEHHSNIIPWIQLKEERGIELQWVDIDDDGNLRFDRLERFLHEGNAKLVAITGQSNVLGMQPPLQEIIGRSHAAGARVLVDAAQLVAHHPIDVQKLDCDFLAFSGHKLYGPTGIGVLYGKREFLEHMPPMLGGGGMVQNVTEEAFVPLDPPARFEAGTPPIAEAVGLAAAIDWLSQFSWEDIIHHEQQLLVHAGVVLSSIPNLTILGRFPLQPTPYNLPPRTGCLSFTLDNLHPHDLTEILGREGICLRAGHHCAEPLHRRLGFAASTRLSIALYNTPEEINRLPAAIERAREILTGKTADSARAHGRVANYKLQTTH